MDQSTNKGYRAWTNTTLGKKKTKYNSNRFFPLSQIVMELKILKKSRQAKISNIYSVLVHAALVLGEKYRSVHLPKRRQA